VSTHVERRRTPCDEACDHQETPCRLLHFVELTWFNTSAITRVRLVSTGVASPGGLEIHGGEIWLTVDQRDALKALLDG
jgi:hypothetical protein